MSCECIPAICGGGGTSWGGLYFLPSEDDWHCVFICDGMNVNHECVYEQASVCGHAMFPFHCPFSTEHMQEHKVSQPQIWLEGDDIFCGGQLRAVCMQFD